MTAAGKKETAADEVLRAHEELRAAETTLNARLVRVAATRIYYSAFHATRALLFAQGLEPKSHAGVQHLFRLHFVRTGLFPTSANRLLGRLQKFREEADYAEVYVPDEPATRRDLEDARAFLAEVEARLAAAK